MGPTSNPGPVPGTTEIMECTSDNECECGDTAKGFYTYTFKVDNVQRCFTVFHPNLAVGDLPIVFSPNCYAKDKLQGIHMTNPNAKDNAAAKRYGYARIGLSSPGMFGYLFVYTYEQ